MIEQSANVSQIGPDEGFKERLQIVFERVGTAKKAAAAIGFSAEQVAKWRDGKASAPLHPVASLCSMTGTSLDWLVFGRESAPLVMTQQALISASAVHAEVAMIPKLDVIASAGPGYENPYPYEMDRLPFPRRWLDWLGVPEEFARFLDSRGDSMEPTIMDGAICLADIRFQMPRLDGVYVLVDGNNVRIKRVGRGFDGKIELISDNPRYLNETLAAPDAQALRVAGKVVWAGGKI